MKRILLLLAFFTGLQSLVAQNQKNIVVDANAEPRKVSGFSAIEVSGAIDLYLSQGSEEALAVSASTPEIRDRIRTEVRGTTLQLFFDSKGLNWKAWGNHKMKAYVTIKDLKRLEASGACNVRITGEVKQPELSIELSGASDISGTLAIGKLRIDASGASSGKFSGTAESTNIVASGASNIKAYDLTTTMCKTNTSGASDIRITVEKELDAVASGGSTVYFKGNGLIRDISTSGGATVKRRSND